MARSHHRKKHKQHLQQFQHSREIEVISKKGRSKWIVTVVGAFFGFAIGNFATDGALGWMIIGLAVGAAIGYFIGIGLDKPVKK